MKYSDKWMKGSLWQYVAYLLLLFLLIYLEDIWLRSIVAIIFIVMLYFSIKEDYEIIVKMEKAIKRRKQK